MSDSRRIPPLEKGGDKGGLILSSVINNHLLYLITFLTVIHLTL
jgi:hypothetical protein